LSIRWELAGSFLGVNLFAVGEYFETAIIVRRKDELADVLFVFGE